MVTIVVYQDGRTQKADKVDPRWLAPGSTTVCWVDLEAATDEEASILRDVFHFHNLAIEDALSGLQFPKAETYDGYLYLVLHGIDFKASQHKFATHDFDFFLGPNYLVSLHDARTRTITMVRETCLRNDRVLAGGAAALLHRLVDSIVDNYQPEVEKLETRLDALEKDVFEDTRKNLIKRILETKRDIASLRRVASPQRDVLSRLARLEFSLINTEVAYGFRDVHDHLVRLTDEALLFQDRVTGVLEAHLSTVSNRLNEVMKLLTVISTIFMPLTLLTGFYGMNVPLPQLPGGESAQAWWLIGIILTLSGVMLWYFRKRGWL